ncbi:MAG: type IV conjugative transfer system protein TraL [Sideroxydans sp.]|nr:type IV conjugative transfer system protein TraL [Sideroxydans sp.]MDD5056628.1 type IV conjugative transfer system protein TraL [Sideroxydans sp.]
MSSMTIEMPEHVDSQAQILFWEMDEFGAGIGIVGIGIMIHWVVTSLIVVAFAVSLIKKMKNNSLNGAAIHAACGTGLFSLNKEFPDLLEKELFI